MKTWDLQFNKKLRTHLFLAAVSILMLYPLIWWVGASFKSNEDLLSPALFPINWLWRNYSDGWVAIPRYTFTHFYINSFELIFLIVVATISSCSLAAFGFARINFPLRKIWFAILMITLMLPGQVILVPQYVLFNGLGWINTYLPLVVPHLLAGDSFFVFMLIQFIRGIPRELDESAKIDGSTWFGIYWRIILPLTKPALVTVAIYCFIWNWDNFFGQLIYLNSVDKYTVVLALRMFIDTQGNLPWGQLLAMSLLSVLPATIIFFLAQRQFVEGIATTGIKG
jgi:ABC-type glycerol-3-phosphate transport system permease component